MAGDFNADGRVDLVLVNEGEGLDSTSTINTLLGTGNGGFSAASGAPVPVGSGAVATTTGDFNGDGKLDVAVAHRSDGTIDVLFGDEAGAFSAAQPSTIHVGHRPVSIVSGDFDNDGRLDLAVADALDSAVNVLIGDGTGGFHPAAAVPYVGNTPSSMIASDFNADGKLDLAVTNQDSRNVSILMGDGHGTFSDAPGSPVASEYAPVSVTAADFNADGHFDLAVANSGSKTVTVLLGNGTGSFAASPASSAINQAGTLYSTVFVSSASSVVAGDFDGDGRADLLVGNDQQGTVTVLLGDGAGGFTEKMGSPIVLDHFNGGPHSIATGDFNSDGRLDFATANGDDPYYGEPSLTVMLNGCP